MRRILHYNISTNMYNPQEIEPKWQKVWEDQKLYATPTQVNPKAKYYILPQLPYPSGQGLHMGHVEVYTACDILARFQRMRGKSVLQVIGWDSFGLPAENYAIKTNVHPQKSTEDAIDNFRKQIKSLGISVDWDREVASHKPEYYQWTQWLFLLMYKRGLAYRKDQAVNWCAGCQTVLANEQVVNGNCERCDTVISQKKMPQWFFAITQYADRLYDDLDKVDWPVETVKRQRDWIGRSEGVEVQFPVMDADRSITIFTTRVDTIFGGTFLVLAPEHPMVPALITKEKQAEVNQYIQQAMSRPHLARTTEEVSGVFTGSYAINPVNGVQIPIWIAEFVLPDYGHGAVFANAHDERDFKLAKKYNIPLKPILKPLDNTDLRAVERLEICYSGDGVLYDSGQFSGLKSEEARIKITQWLESQGIGKRTTIYKLRDWSVSRQRFWGAPVPIVYDPQGNPHPVDADDLPVTLPQDVNFKPTGQSPLTYSVQFQEGVEEKYGQGWKRDVETLDTFVDSSWYYFRYLDPHNNQEFASKDSLKTWMPVDFYLGGAEHVNGHLLYARFVTKVLFDAGLIDFDEPFLMHRHQGFILGEDKRKMSKRWNNIINPTDVIDQFGADTVRMYEMFMGPLEQDKPWDTNGIKGVRRFLERVWRLQDLLDAKDDLYRNIHELINNVTQDTETLSFNTAIAHMMEFVNLVHKQGKISKESLISFCLILAPYAPHITEEIWHNLGHKNSIHSEQWPQFDQAAIRPVKTTLVVQINGKTRGTIEIDASANQAQAEAMVQSEKKFKQYLHAPAQRVIFVPGKIINFII